MIKLTEIMNELNVPSHDKVDIYRDNNFIVVRPLTYEASRKYGCDTNWCTSTSNPMFWENHSKDGNFLIYIIDRRRKPAKQADRNDKVRNFHQLYHDDKWDKLPQQQKDNFLDFSRIAVSVEYDKGEQYPNIHMVDANDLHLDADFDYNSINDLPISPNVKKAIDKYMWDEIENHQRPHRDKGTKQQHDPNQLSLDLKEQMKSTKENIAKSAIKDVFTSRPSRSISRELWPSFEKQIADTVHDGSVVSQVMKELQHDGWLKIVGDQYQWKQDYSPVNESKKTKAKTKEEYGCLMLQFNIKNWKKITDIIDDEDVYDNDDKEYGKETEPHVTVLYGFLEDVTPEILKKVTSKITEPIEISFKNISAFNTELYDVVKFEIYSETLRNLNKLVSRLPHVSKHKEYNPHMTIAYVKNGMGKKYVRTLKNKISAKSSEFKFSDAGMKHKTFWKIKGADKMKEETLVETLQRLIREEMQSVQTQQVQTQSPSQPQQQQNQPTPGPNDSKIAKLQQDIAKYDEDINKINVNLQPLMKKKSDIEAKKARLQQQMTTLQKGNAV